MPELIQEKVAKACIVLIWTVHDFCLSECILNLFLCYELGNYRDN
jgi:hypothetical protein